MSLPEKDPLPPGRNDTVFHHIIDEMPLRVVLAVMFVVFFFFWGAVNAVIKLLGYEVASIRFPIGILVGFITANAAFFIIRKIKHRTR